MSDRSNFITFHKKDFTIEQIKDSCEGFEIFICEVSNNENDHVNEYVFIYPEEKEGKNYPENSDDKNLARIISNKLQIPVLWIFCWETAIYASVHSNGKLDSFFERDYSDIIYDWWGITDEEDDKRWLKAEEREKDYSKTEEPLNGLVYDYAENGKRIEFGYLVNGYQDGTWKFFYENGKPSMENIYKNGKFIETTQRWDGDGKL